MKDLNNVELIPITKAEWQKSNGFLDEDLINKLRKESGLSRDKCMEYLYQFNSDYDKAIQHIKNIQRIS